MPTWSYRKWPREVAHSLASEPLTVVVHRDPEHAGAHADPHLDMTGGVTGRVVDDVYEHLRHPLGVHARDRASEFLEAKSSAGMTRFDRAPRTFDKCADVDGREAEA